VSAPHGEIRLVINGSLCDGHGICALVMPERVSLDVWGYASVDATPLDDAQLIARGRRVVRACPAKALSLSGDPRATAPRRVTLGRRDVSRNASKIGEN